MNTALFFRRAMQLGWALAIGTVGLSSQAQTANRAVRPVPQRQAPALAIGAVGPGAPSPTGLASPIPNPAGLTSQFPGGLPAPPVNSTGLPAPADTTQPPSITTGAGGRPTNPDGLPPTTTVMGYGAPAGPLPSGLGRGPYTALQIAQSFLAADANRDGELTRAEAQRLTIAPYTFEEMDRNHDGILTRFEYEDAMH
jgi:hypothetical protein